MIKYGKFFILIIIILQISACKVKNEKMKNKFDWDHRISSPKNYPVEVVQGSLNDSSGSIAVFSPIFGITTGKGGWGTPGRLVSSGDPLKEIPESLNITWLSFREDKFYTGEFKLPKQKITELFGQSIYGDYEEEYFDFIIIGLAPGGVVVIWLMGDQVQTEVARFQATEINKDQLHITGDEKIMLTPDYTSKKLDNRSIKRDPIPFGLWDKYREKYNWRLKPVFPEQFRQLKQWIRMYNGEKEHYSVEQKEYEQYKPRAVPSFASITWYDEKGNKFGYDVDFDEEEIFKAFKAIYREDHKQEVDLIFTLDDKRKGFIIKLRSKEEEYEFLKCDGGMYTMKKD